MGPKYYSDLPVGVRFRPTDCECADYFLKKKALGLPMNARTEPEDCHDISSLHPRDLDGYPEEEHWYLYCKRINQENSTSSLWIPTGEESVVLDPNNNDELVGIKRSFAFIENKEELDDIYLSEEECEEYNWFMDEISLPLTVVDTDLVVCHIFGERLKPFLLSHMEPELNQSDEDRERVDKPAETMDIDETVLPPPPPPPASASP